MVRSAVVVGGHAQQDGHDAAAAAALARLSKAAATTQRLPAGTVSVRVLLIVVVVLLSLGVLVPIVSRSKNDLAVHSVPRMPRTANLHLGQADWKRYTLRQAAQVSERATSDPPSLRIVRVYYLFKCHANFFIIYMPKICYEA